MVSFDISAVDVNAVPLLLLLPLFLSVGGRGAVSTPAQSSCPAHPTTSCLDRMCMLWLPSWTSLTTGRMCRYLRTQCYIHNKDISNQTD